jgi:hypothetical protein
LSALIIRFHGINNGMNLEFAKGNFISFIHIFIHPFISFIQVLLMISHSSFIICSLIFYSSFFTHLLSSIISMSFVHNFHSSIIFIHPIFIYVFPLIFYIHLWCSHAHKITFQLHYLKQPLFSSTQMMRSYRVILSFILLIKFILCCIE